MEKLFKQNDTLKIIGVILTTGLTVIILGIVLFYNDLKTPPPPPSGKTGALVVTSIPEAQTKLDVKNRLRQTTPISTETFTLTFDYASNRFLVSSKQPFTPNEFWVWIEQNNYTSIPQDLFQFISTEEP